LLALVQSGRMRHAASRANQAQLDLPGLAPPAAPELPDVRRAVACVRCGWYREAATATCPVCQHRSPADPPR